MLFLIYLWRSRHAERLNVSIKTPHRRIWTESLVNLVSRSLSKIKISNDPWIASYICYAYFSKLRFFYHCQCFVMSVGSEMLTSKAGSEHCHTQWQHAIIPDLNNLSVLTQADSEHFGAVFDSPCLVHSENAPSGIQIPNWAMKLKESQASLDYYWFSKKLSRLPTENNEKAVLSRLLRPSASDMWCDCNSQPASDSDTWL